jgi:hypothetical protein
MTLLNCWSFSSYEAIIEMDLSKYGPVERKKQFLLWSIAVGK